MPMFVVRYVIVAAAMALAPLVSYAQGPGSLEELRRKGEIDRAIETINQAQAGLDAFIKRRESDCIKAVGYQPFCDCILSELPVAWGFSDYVAIVTKTKDENGYASMKADLKAAYDKVPPIRDRCVKAINTRPQPTRDGGTRR
jgi:hypothetical protein